MSRRISRKEFSSEWELIYQDFKGLLLAWAESESIKINGRAMFMPCDTYAWRKNKIGGYEKGSFTVGHCCKPKYIQGKNGEWEWVFGDYKPGEFVQGQAGFDLERCTAPRRHSRIDEFGDIFRRQDDFDQELMIVAEMGGMGWPEIARMYPIPQSSLEERYSRVLLVMIWQCQRRGLI